MPQKKIIFNSLKESFILIWKNKALFVLLLMLQIAFFAALFFVNLTYQTKILESAKAMTDYMGKQKLDEATVASNVLHQKSILGEDPLMISRNFNDILKNFRLYLASLFILLIIFISAAWSLTTRLIHGISPRQLVNRFLKIFAISLFYLGLIFIFFFSLLNISLTELAAESSKFLVKYVVFAIFSLTLAYFMFISLSLANKTGLKNIVQRTLAIGIKKAHYVLAVYFIDISLLGIPIVLSYYFIEKNLFVLLMSLILTIFSFVFGRIFMINVAEKLEEE